MIFKIHSFGYRRNHMNSKDRRAFFDRHILITVLAAAAMMIMIGETLLSYFNYLVRQQQKEFLQLAHAGIRRGDCYEKIQNSIYERRHQQGLHVFKRRPSR